MVSREIQIVGIIGVIALIIIIFLSGCEGPPEDCIEDWRCTDWSTCIEAEQTRECTDISNCGTKLSKPAEIQSCTVDLCAGVTCPDKCEGTTLMKEGTCVDGQCNYTSIENSVECGYTEAELDLNTIFRFCEYYRSNKEFNIFFTIRTLGDKNPDPAASIWLVPDNPEYSQPYFTIQRQYEKNQLLWESLFWSGIPYKGRMWTVRNVPEFEEFNYQLIYCEIEDPARETCSEINGIVLYSGNTLTDCEDIESN